MEETRLERLEYILCFAVMGLVPLHLCLSVSNLANGIDKGYGHSYPLCAYVLIGLYLMIVLATDLFMICQRKLEAAKALRWYWFSACGAVVAALFLYLTASEHDAVMLLSLLYSPYVVLTPLLELLEAGMEEYDGMVSLAAVGAFCLFNWAVCQLAAGKKRGEGTA